MELAIYMPNSIRSRSVAKISSRRRRFNTGWLFVLPALAAFALFKYYPILSGFFITFFKYKIMDPPGPFVGLANYVRAVKDPYVRNAIANNLSLWAIMIVMNFWVPLVLAIMVNEVRKFKTLIRTLYYIPAILPSVVMTVLWKYIWQPDYGFANYLLGQVNIAPKMWLNDPNLVKWCMRVPYLLVFAGLATGMNFIIYLAALNNVPKENYESAQLDGAGFWNKLRYITFPAIKSTLGMVLVTNTIDIFNLFDEPKIMTGGGPARASETLVLYGFDRAYTGGDYSYAITITTISFIIVFLLTVLQMRFQKPKDE